jgi:hypothetical protein
MDYRKGTIYAPARLRYRVALHAGTPSQAGLDKVYRQWLKETP